MDIKKLVVKELEEEAEYDNLLAELMLDLESDKYSKITSGVEIIEPSYALEMVKNHNSLNRTPSDGTVNSYVQQIENGKWEVNGESIIISEPFGEHPDGIILDGQHRLIACIKTGKPIASIVVRGINHNTFDTIDSGKSRSYNDTVSASKVFDDYGFKKQQYGYASSIAKQKMEYDYGRMCSHGHYSTRPTFAPKEVNAELFKNIDAYCEIVNKAILWVNPKFTNGNKLYPSGKKYGAIAAHLILTCGWDKETVFRFFEHLASGSKEISAINSLRMNISNEISSKGMYKPSDVIYFFTKAWSDYIFGEERSNAYSRSKNLDPKLIRFISKEEFESRNKRKNIEKSRSAMASNELEYAIVTA